MTKIPGIGDQLDVFEEANRRRRDEELAKMDKKEEKQSADRLRNIRNLLAKRNDELLPNDFLEFKDDLISYDKRLTGFRKEFDSNNTDAEAKEALWAKLVDPQIHDEPKYHDIAALYLKYQEVADLARRYPKAAQELAQRRKQEALEKSPSNKEEETHKEDEDDDSNDPWSDIFPYNRDLRKGKR